MLSKQSNKDFLLQWFWAGCLFLGVTGASPLVGWENVKPHPDLKRYLLLSVVVLGGIVAWLRYLKHEKSFYQLQPVRFILAFFEWPATLSVAFIFLLYYFTQTLSVIALHAGLETALWDFGFYNQIIWNSAHGHSLMTSVRGGIHLFSEHFKPILMFLTPLYKYSDSANLMLAVTTLISSSTLIASYWVTREITKSHKAGLVLMLCVFFYLPLRNGINFPIHSQTFADPLILFGFYCLLKKWDLLSLVLFSLALMCKESVTMDVLGIGVFLVATRQRKGFDVILLALIFFAFVFFFIEPGFRYPFHFVQKWSFYIHFKQMTLEAWARLLEPNPFIFLYRILGPFLFMTFLCKRWWLLLGPSLAMRLLSNYPGLRTITDHYTAGLNALIILSAIFGVAYVLKTEGTHNKFLIFFKNQKILFISLIFTAFSFSAIPQMFSIDKNLWRASQPAYQQSIRVMERIPEEFSVLAPPRLAAHLFKRQYLFSYFEMFPATPLQEMAAQPDLVIIDKERTRMEEHRALSEFIAKGYEEIYSNEAVIIFDHPAKGRNISRELREQWQAFDKVPRVIYRNGFRAIYGVLLLMAIGVYAGSLARKKKSVPTSAPSEQLQETTL